ncbi:MAG: DUF115 domain-containing protein [Methanobrevibacter sp.]|nr:DUF115 domain-containing protein [Methanobrevibacter sp.]
MDFEIWEKSYMEILDDFGFSRDGDESSASTLNILLNLQGSLTFEDLQDKITNCRDADKVIVFGAGPSLKNSVIKLKRDYDLNDYVLISADGATTALIEEKIVPDIVVTDLDGNIDDILIANTRDAAVVVHAHGDNEESLLKYTEYFTNVLGTTQSKPFGNLYNFGGFTDGDRAVFLAVALGAKDILLAGMDFGDVVTKYSRPNNKNLLEPADDIKKKKLQYGEKLLSWIEDNEDVCLTFL